MTYPAIMLWAAYVDAGADAILMHSKKSKPTDIEEFMAGWNNRAPVVIVPTKYYETPTDDFRKLGVSMVIWANHNMRAAVTAMQQTSKVSLRLKPASTPLCVSSDPRLFPLSNSTFMSNSHWLVLKRTWRR